MVPCCNEEDNEESSDGPSDGFGVRLHFRKLVADHRLETESNGRAQSGNNKALVRPYEKGEIEPHSMCSGRTGQDVYRSRLKVPRLDLT